MNNTIHYYNTNIETYVESTIHIDMSKQYGFFEKRLSGKCILDLGFGSGRDSLYFVNKGYSVYAVDPSEQFCKHAREVGIPNVYQMSAQEINFENQFDGIWACASLLHVPFNELSNVFCLCTQALKEDGTMYASFKYGDTEREVNGRRFTDMTLSRLEDVLKDSGLSIVDSYESIDNRPDVEDRWLNVILKRML